LHGDELHLALEDVADVVLDGAHFGDAVLAPLLEARLVARLVQLARGAAGIGLALVAENKAGLGQVLAEDGEAHGVPRALPLMGLLAAAVPVNEGLGLVLWLRLANERHP